MHTQEIGFFIFGLLFGGLMTHVLLTGLAMSHNQHDQHPIADPYDGQYHVHADFHIVINGELLDLSDDIFQTTSAQELHPDLHLHDNTGDVKHIHAENKTFADFLASLNIILNNDCLTVPAGVAFCADDERLLHLYVNDTLYTDDYTTYVPVDNDRILVYFGTSDTSLVQPLLDAVPNDSCIYSGTCPERGIAPPESCGLTCEI